MKAIGYLRVSTDQQALDGISLDAQEAKVRDYCALHGLSLVGQYTDAGLSGKRADNRAGLQSAIDAVCEIRGVLVVHSLSRLARSTFDCIQIARDLEKCGADLASITEKIDTTTGMGRFFFRLMASLGELERDQISERTRAVLAHKKARGERVGRFAPYGWDFDETGSTLVENRTEQVVIEQVRTWRAEGMSLRAIARRLSSLGVSPKHGSRWHAKVIASILSR